MSSNKYALTEQEFDRLKQRLSKRYTQQNISAAHAVMVRGRTMAEVARDIHRTRQHVSNIVRSLWALHAPANKVPENWVRVVATLPPDMAVSVQEMEKEAVRKLRN